MTWINAPKDITPYQGFVYQIFEKDTGMSYIGKKNFWKRIRRKPLKGKKRVRIDRVESDWSTYNSSCKELAEKIEKNPGNYEKDILWLCKSKEEMAILETKEQLEYYPAKWDLLYNEILNMRVRVRKNVCDAGDAEERQV